MSDIFISYRVDDAEDFAVQLSDQLSKRFGKGTTCRQAYDTDGDQQLIHRIESEIESCKVVITVIGDKWVKADDEQGKARRADPNACVHHLLSTALKKGKTVIPVLQSGVRMPDEGSLPPDLTLFSKLEPLEILDPENDKRLIQRIRPLIAVQHQRAKAKTRPMQLPRWLTKWLWFWPRIFISYRHADSQKSAQLIAKYLRSEYLEKSVFIDTSDLRQGDLWSDALDKQLRRCNVLLVVIGEQWLDIKNKKTGRCRLEDPDDVVVREVSAGLERKRSGEKDLVLPVLVDGAEMPPVEALPRALRSLPSIEGNAVRGGLFLDRDVNTLVKGIDEHLGPVWKFWKAWSKELRLARALAALLLGLFAIFLAIPLDLDVSVEFPEGAKPSDYTVEVFRTNKDGSTRTRVSGFCDGTTATSQDGSVATCEIPVRFADKIQSWDSSFVWAVASPREPGSNGRLEGRQNAGFRHVASILPVSLRELREIHVRVRHPSEYEIQVFKNRLVDFETGKLREVEAERVNADTWRLPVQWEDIVGTDEVSRIHARASCTLPTGGSCPELTGFAEVDFTDPPREVFINLECVEDKSQPEESADG